MLNHVLKYKGHAELALPLTGPRESHTHTHIHTSESTPPPTADPTPHRRDDLHLEKLATPLTTSVEEGDGPSSLD